MVTHVDTAIQESVGVVGGGTMGVGIAYVFALGGWSTTVVEPDDERARQLSITIADATEQGVARGKLSLDQAADLTAAVRRVRSIGELESGLGLIIETVPERLALKQAVLTEIDGRHPSIIATNTSALSIDVLAGGVKNPSTFLGMHFFNPVWSLPMVELVLGAATTAATVDQARRIALSIGKETISVADSPGFATSRLDLIASLEAMRMFEDQVASADDIDRAMVLAYRHPIGPLRLSDIVGLDVRLDIAQHLAAELGPRYEPPRVLRDKVAAGELGRKSGRGFFEWPGDTPEGGNPAPPFMPVSSTNTSRGT